jgi:3',5'-cyclic AMP phosphodiesterase CpdA
MTEPLFSFVHMSDTHLPGDPNESFQGRMKAHDAARVVIAQVNALPFPVEFVLHTGDVGNDPQSEADYAPVRETLSALKLPLHIIPGNHDQPEWMYSAVAGRAAPPHYYTFEAKNVRFICLNSTIPGQGDGMIGAEQLEWLAAKLAEPTGMPIVVALHHHPFSMTSDAMDQYILRDGEALHSALVTGRENLICVLFGHIHETVAFARDGITYSSVAAVCMTQLRSWPGQQALTLDDSQTLGFNVVSILPDGTALIRAWRVPVEGRA